MVQEDSVGGALTLSAGPHLAAGMPRKKQQPEAEAEAEPPKWWVLQGGRKELPAFYQQPQAKKDKKGKVVGREPLLKETTTYFSGLLTHLDDLLRCCTPLLPAQSSSLRSGRGLEVVQDSVKVASDGGEEVEWPLYTQCLLVVNCKSYLKEEGCPFKLQPHGRHGGSRTSKSSGYLKVKGGSWDHQGPGDVYLHQLLCWMYWGPPPEQGGQKMVVGHCCHHKQCICPWHLRWMSQGQNVRMGNLHRRQQDGRWAPGREAKAGS